MPGVIAPEPLPLESLTSYLRRTARRYFFPDAVSFLRRGGVDWPNPGRDPDLLTGPVLEQVAALLDLDTSAVDALTVYPSLEHLVGHDLRVQRGPRWLDEQTRVCDHCVAIQSYGRIHWRVPLVTECLVHGRPLLEACRVCGATRHRLARRWERFDCGHHVRCSAGGDSNLADLRVQHLVQAALGVAHAQPTEASGWLVHAAVARWSWLGDAQSTREILRDLWADPRHSRLTWERAATALGARADRGLQRYPSLNAPPAAPPVATAPALSPEALRDTMQRLLRRYAARTRGADGSPA
jgi:hypothetical protein